MTNRTLFQTQTLLHLIRNSRLRNGQPMAPSSPLYRPHSGRSDWPGNEVNGHNWNSDPHAQANPMWWKVEINPGKLLATRVRVWNRKAPWNGLAARRLNIRNAYLLVDDAEVGRLKEDEKDRVPGTNLNMLWMEPGTEYQSAQKSPFRSFVMQNTKPTVCLQEVLCARQILLAQQSARQLLSEFVMPFFALAL